jgi:hypothetical protein
MKELELPFRARYEIAKILLKDNPSQKDVIVKWMVEKHEP